MFQHFSDKLKKVPQIWWLLAAIFVVGIFLRTYNHHDWLRFNADQGRDAALVSSVVDGAAQWPSFGPKAGGTEFKLGPAFYDFAIVSAKIFGNAPDKMAYPDLFTSILSIPLLYFFLKKYFEKYASLTLTAIFAVSSYAVFYSRFAWNPNSLPFWTLLALYAIHEVVSRNNNRKFWWAALAGVAIGIDVQLHTTILAILPLTAIVVFAYFAIKRKEALKYFLVILAVSLFMNIPQFVSEIQTNGKNMKAFFGGVKTKGTAESTLVNNTIHGTSCWIQGNIYIVSGYEISDTCSFDPSKNAADTLVFFAGSVFVIGGVFLGIRYFLKETDSDRWSFLAVVFVFTGITFLVFLKFAFELSVRFYLPLIFLPFLLLGFWVQFITNKFGFRRTVYILAAFFVATNLVFVQKYYAALADYGNAGGGSSDVIILREAEVFSRFIVENSSGNTDAYIDGDGKFLFKGFKSIGYLAGKSNIKLKLAGKNSELPDQYFYIASLKKREKMVQDGSVNEIRYQTFADFAIMLVEKNENK